MLSLLNVIAVASLMRLDLKTTTNDPASCSAVASPIDCGYTNITSAQCIDRGCCWSEGLAIHAADSLLNSSSCFFPADGVPVKRVHLIQSNHLDVGYDDLATGIVNEWFDTYFPRAASIGKQLRQIKGSAQTSWLRWMTQSYIVSLYLDCPANMGLHCPNETAIASFRDAVRAGDITWQAFPHNPELGIMDPSLIAFGVQMTHDLDDQFGLPHKTTFSQRDVPGMPRGAIRALGDAKVTMISEGSNGKVEPVNVPLAFVWRNKDAEPRQILTLWHPYGYGQIPQAARAPVTLQLPGCDEALVYAWRGDDTGPPDSTDEVLSNYAYAQARFPGAQVLASHFDNFSVAVATKAKLPLITTDLGDTWAMGVPSDPIKTARMKAIQRIRSKCYEDGVCSDSDVAVYNFSRLFIK
jgi:hypothetical protein